MPIFVLSDRLEFPHPRFAEKDGLLAIGGDLGQDRLLLAYRMGIFPWFSDNEPILWWSPDPRLILDPKNLRVPRSLQKIIRRRRFRITMDTAFERVITGCARVRLQNREGTWIGDRMIDAHCGLHRSGFAHSVEAWVGDELAGGLYGVSLGGCFFGESMFTRISNASKAALVALAEHLTRLSIGMIDCQVKTPHLIRFGAREIPRARFLDQLHQALKEPTRKGLWILDEFAA